MHAATAIALTFAALQSPNAMSIRRLPTSPCTWRTPQAARCRSGVPPRLLEPVGSSDKTAAASVDGALPSAAAPRLAPLVVLSLVPLAWGTYGPAIKSLYSLEAPPPELLFNLMNYVVSAATLVAVSLVRARLGSPDGPSSSTSTNDPSEPAPSTAAPSGDALLAGAELGGYLFLGSTVQVC